MDVHKQTIVFNKSDGSFWFMGTVLPSNYDTTKHVIAIMPQGEDWDTDYQYSLVNGVITKGEKCPEPTEVSE